MGRLPIGNAATPDGGVQPHVPRRDAGHAHRVRLLVQPVAQLADQKANQAVQVLERLAGCLQRLAQPVREEQPRVGQLGRRRLVHNLPVFQPARALGGAVAPRGLVGRGGRLGSFECLRGDAARQVEQSADLPLGQVHPDPALLARIVQHGRGSLVLGDQRGQNRRQRALQVQEALGEGRGRHLNATLVGAVDLEVVTVRRVQPQHAAAHLVARVQRVPKLRPQPLGLRFPERRQLSAPLENKERLRRTLARAGFGLLPVARPRLGLLALTLVLRQRLPCDRLDLHLPVDAREGVRLQHLEHRDQLIQLLVVAITPGCLGTGRPGGGGGAHGPLRLLPRGQPLLHQRGDDDRQLLHGPDLFDLELGARVRLVPQQPQQCWFCRLHLQLLLGRPVAVPRERHHAQQLRLVRVSRST
mmetsp:Transcript_7972/g.26229  ORF Transcript_7972/g.26229 Transcript_7972/m.26229 type:complete len:415 (+) Transcript_7972:1146-2390(+)